MAEQSASKIYKKLTDEEWNAIQKDSTWNYYCETITVKCSDGSITV